MIFYFSGTGNCKHVAEKIAEAIEDSVSSIAECVDKQQYAHACKNGEAIGIVAPTYYLGLPTIVNEFLKKMNVTGAAYCFFVATYGTTTGNTGNLAKTAFQNRNLSIDARFSVKMTDVWTPMFDVSDPAKTQAQNEAAERQIDEVIEKVKRRAQGDFMKHKAPGWISRLYYKGYDKKRETKHFVIESSCIGCGLCETKCPAHAIQMQDGRPAWVFDHCIMCLGCLHRCPAFAIQYGEKTKGHGQYQNPYTTL